MADEARKLDGKKLLSTMIKVVLGLGFLILGVLTILRWWPQLVEIIKGCIGLFLILAGIITLAIAKE
ncbi:MAG: hypothetical protein V1923_06460 [Candidatus Omnitrophota bacterium]